jgi:hypothetical protein
VKLQAAALVALLVVACNGHNSPQGTGTASEPSQAAGTAGVAERAVPAVPASAEAGATARDSSAIAALERMGAYLRGLTTFQIRGETSRDEVLDDGQSVEFAAVVDMIVQRPNRIRAEVTSDRKQRLYFGDGKTFSVWAKRMNYYATIPAPPTLRELADTLADKYDLELPLVDLFYWGERKSLDDIRGASDIGASQVDGVTCEHYAFRQEGADWQVWIQQGDYPLPRRLVITTTTDAARPQYAATLTWNLAPSYDDTAFTFVPPKDAKRITLVEMPAPAPATTPH